MNPPKASSRESGRASSFFIAPGSWRRHEVRSVREIASVERRGGSKVKEMSSDEWHDAVRRGLRGVSKRLASGDLDGSGPFYTDEELAAGAATGGKRKTEEPDKARAA